MQRKDIKQDKTKVTLEKVINGLKFIAENQTLSQTQMIKNLLQLECNFTLEDIKKQLPKQTKIFEGIRQGNLFCGALIIFNVMDSECNRAFCNDKFLSVDDEFSIYHFIRIATGNESYTKENIDPLSKGKQKTYK